MKPALSTRLPATRGGGNGYYDVRRDRVRTALTLAAVAGVAIALSNDDNRNRNNRNRNDRNRNDRNRNHHHHR